MAFTLTSAAFADGATIPKRHTGDGENVSPPLAWQDAPGGTMGFALIVDDPDAPGGTFQHWGIYNIAARVSGLPEGVGGGFDSVANDYAVASYRGPRPPAGHGPHRYRFRVLALGIDRLALPLTANVADLWAAADPHLVGEAVLTGIYER